MIRERKSWNIVVVMVATVFLCAGLSILSGAEGGTIKITQPKKEGKKAKEVKKAPAQEKIPLTIVKSTKTSAHVEMNNSMPVRGVQFTLDGTKIVEVRTTPRTTGFLIKFNEKNGMVLLVSAAADTIAPGKGAIAEVICDTPGAARLSGVKVVAAVATETEKK